MFFVIRLLHAAAVASTPYAPSPGFTYYLEAVRSQAWPACGYRFASYPAACDHVDLWDGVGEDQEFVVERSSDTPGVVHLKMHCGTYVSVSADCATTGLTSSSKAANPLTAFRFLGSGSDNGTTGVTLSGWTLEAVGRPKACAARFLSFGSTCSTNKPDAINLAAAGDAGKFLLHIASRTGTLPVKAPSSSEQCADPFAWQSEGGKGYRLVCTGGDLSLFYAQSLNSTTVFQTAGVALGGSMPRWAGSGNRWAPENVEHGAGGANTIFFSDDYNGPHRVGWSFSKTGERSSWDTYPEGVLNLGNSKGGEIDQHVFTDTDGSTYLFWKTDDNSVNLPYTRLWAQEIQINEKEAGVTLVGSRKEVLNSTHLWWSDSFITDGSLIEGPEVVYHKKNGFYYLFFASGKYCTTSYSEGVARSKSIFGPYEKLGVQFLSTALVGNAQTGPDDDGSLSPASSAGEKQVGPGHASFVQRASDDAWFAVYHASPGNNCNRYAFTEQLKWSDDGWPYVDFSA